MAWKLVFNPSPSLQIPVDNSGRVCDPGEFTYADGSLQKVIDLLGAGKLIHVPIYFDPNGSPTGIDREAFDAAGEVILRNGGSWEPPEEPEGPYTLAQLDQLVRVGRLSVASLAEAIGSSGGMGNLIDSQFDGVWATRTTNSTAVRWVWIDDTGTAGPPPTAVPRHDLILVAQV